MRTFDRNNTGSLSAVWSPCYVITCPLHELCVIIPLTRSQNDPRLENEIHEASKA